MTHPDKESDAMFRDGYPDRALFLDSSLPFCDRKCLYLKVAVVLYRDNNRLTCEGSLLLVRAFADRINRLIGRPVFRFRQGQRQVLRNRGRRERAQSRSRAG